MVSKSIQYKGIMNVSLAEASFKVVTHWYLKHECLPRMYPDSSVLSFGFCGKANSFWIWVHALIYSVTMGNIKNSRVALFNEPVKGVPRHTQGLIYIMFLVAKIGIVSAWKKPLVNLAVMTYLETYLDPVSS